MPIRINGTDRPSTINQSSPSPMGTYHMAANTNLYEIQRTNNFEFIVTDIDGIQRAGMIGGEANGSIANGQEIIRMAVASATVPFFSQSAIEVKRGNSTMKFAGVPTFDAGTIKVNDYIGASAKEVLLAWQALSYNVVTEKVGLASDYKKDCYLVEYTPDYQKVRQWKMHGCWISKLSGGEFNSDNNEKMQIDAEIQYDKAELDTSDVV
jgi:hypothetical protein